MMIGETILPATQKIRARGKFLYNGEEKFYVKGVTYGTFKPDEGGILFPDSRTVETDFAMMSKHGINAIRTYTAPPPYLFELAAKYGLGVMVGLPWEQHISFLDDPKQKKDIIKRVKARSEERRV